MKFCQTNLRCQDFFPTPKLDTQLSPTYSSHNKDSLIALETNSSLQLRTLLAMHKLTRQIIKLKIRLTTSLGKSPTPAALCGPVFGSLSKQENSQTSCNLRDVGLPTLISTMVFQISDLRRSLPSSDQSLGSINFASLPICSSRVFRAVSESSTRAMTSDINSHKDVVSCNFKSCLGASSQASST